MRDVFARVFCIRKDGDMYLSVSCGPPSSNNRHGDKAAIARYLTLEQLDFFHAYIYAIALAIEDKFGENLFDIIYTAPSSIERFTYRDFSIETAFHMFMGKWVRSTLEGGTKISFYVSHLLYPYYFLSIPHREEYPDLWYGGLYLGTLKEIASVMMRNPFVRRTPSIDVFGELFMKALSADTKPMSEHTKAQIITAYDHIASIEGKNASAKEAFVNMLNYTDKIFPMVSQTYHKEITKILFDYCLRFGITCDL